MTFRGRTVPWSGPLCPQTCKLAQVAREAAEAALFGVFCVLDGVRVIEDTWDKGDLELHFIKNGNRTLINDPKQEPLHDQFQRLRDCQLGGQHPFEDARRARAGSFDVYAH